jgi:hypothetical protein
MCLSSSKATHLRGNSCRNSCKLGACSCDDEVSKTSTIAEDIDDDDVGENSCHDPTKVQDSISSEFADSEDDIEIGFLQRNVSVSEHTSDQIADVAKIVMHLRQDIKHYSNEEKFRFIQR